MTCEVCARNASVSLDQVTDAPTMTIQHRMNDVVSTKCIFTDLQDQPPVGRSLKRHGMCIFENECTFCGRTAHPLGVRLNGHTRHAEDNLLCVPIKFGAMPMSGSAVRGTPSDLCAFAEKRARFLGTFVFSALTLDNVAWVCPSVTWQLAV